MTEASDIMKFDTRCALERFGKVVSTFTEEQNEVLYLNSVVYDNIGGDVSKSDRDNNVNRILSAPHLVIKKLDAHAEDIKGLSSNIIELTACVESQNKFLYDMMSMIKAWVSSKSHCDWDTFVKKDEKCMSMKLHDDPPTEEKKRHLSKVEDNIPHIINLLDLPKNRIGRSSEVNFPPSTLYRAGPFVVTTPISDADLRILSYALDDNLDKGLKT
ncbi:hypothetical protein WN943_010117 [Citrus x changshan-huyou]